jgi:hypothetical protein
MVDGDIIARFRERQGALMLLAALEGKPALDLIHSNPCLAFCLALNWEFHRPTVSFPMHAAREQLRRRQRDISGWLGFPGTEAFANLLRKVLPESASVQRCLDLREAVANAELARMLSHLPRINAGVLALVGRTQFHSILTPRLLAEVAMLPGEDTKADCARTIEDIHHMARLLAKDPPAQPIPSCKRLHLIHEAMVCEVNEREIPGYRGHDLPAPPLKGIRRGPARITPIRSTEQLNHLGREQHNCVASYASRIRRGEVFIYRVHTARETCTLAISRDNDKPWAIHDLRAACNHPPHPTTLRMVRGWLANVQAPANRNASIVNGAGHTHAGASGDAGQQPIAPVPVAGISNGGIEIAPVTGWSDLEAIAQLDGSDVGQRSRKMRSGTWYAYRIRDGGEELVLLIARTGSRRWRLQDLWSSSGLPVRGATLAIVSAWLGRMQGAFR